MKNLLILYTRNIHFTFNNEIYLQNDGVAMGSPLAPVLAGIFMVELENALVLKQHIKNWRHYVDDNFVYVNSPQNSPQQLAIAKANSVFVVITLARILPR